MTSFVALIVGLGGVFLDQFGEPDDEKEAVLKTEVDDQQLHRSLPQQLANMMRHLSGRRTQNVEKNERATKTTFGRLQYAKVSKTGGWCDLDRKFIGQLHKSTTVDHILHLVLNDNKGRYQLRHGRCGKGLYQIRCLNGHSRRWGELMGSGQANWLKSSPLRHWMTSVWTQVTADDVPQCVHGTTYESMGAILASGELCPMDRTFVHFATGDDADVFNHRATVIVHIDVKKWHADGHEVWLVPNGVVHLVQHDGRREVPMRYWSAVEIRDASIVRGLVAAQAHLRRVVTRARYARFVSAVTQLQAVVRGVRVRTC